MTAISVGQQTPVSMWKKVCILNWDFDKRTQLTYVPDSFIIVIIDYNVFFLSFFLIINFHMLQDIFEDCSFDVLKIFMKFHCIP